jgi:hypothetical protein
MQNPVRLPLYLTWSALKQLLGWPYGRAQTWRMMQTTIRRSRGNVKEGTFVTWVEPNLDPFPRCAKLGNFRSSHPQWYTPDVVDYYRRHGFRVPEFVEFSA